MRSVANARRGPGSRVCISCGPSEKGVPIKRKNPDLRGLPGAHPPSTLSTSDGTEVSYGVRFGLILGLLCGAGAAKTDRLILIPTARKINIGDIRAEYLFSGRNQRFQQAYIALPVGHSFEADLLFEKTDDKSVGSLDFAYNYVVPITDTTPGLTFGVRDVLNRTQYGRALYAAATWRFGVEDTTSATVPMELTIGAGPKPIRGAFVGVMLPFSNEVRLLVEHDSIQATAGLELRPIRRVPELALRGLFRQDQSLWSLGYTARF